MTETIIQLLLIFLGLAVTPLLFYRFPRLPVLKKDSAPLPKVSVIIPARNEEHNLPFLLKDLSEQTHPALEILCVDDESVDATAQVALSGGARLISIRDKPEGWTGKTWACQRGADEAMGDLLLFLDADVRLEPNGLSRLVQAYQEEGRTISVQPYHRTEKGYEQFSLLFNLIQVAANGIALPNPSPVGLFGPVILIAKSEYQKGGGHRAARASVVEDLALGLQLKKAGISYRLFLGDEGIAFRMYGGGFGSLVQGWVKNMATGAVMTPPPVFWMVFIWMTSLTSVPMQLVFSLFQQTVWWILYGVLYICWVVALAALGKRIGRFHLWSFLFYPVLLPVLIGVFLLSGIKKLLGLNVTWKGRSIALRKKP